jgi:hypothetical protein
MTEEPTLIERLRAKDRAWQEQCDGWLADAREQGEVTDEQEAAMRYTIYAEAVNTLERTITPVPDGGMTQKEKGDFAEALARAMEPEAWSRINSGEPDECPPNEDSIRALTSIRHASAVMAMLSKEGMI